MRLPRLYYIIPAARQFIPSRPLFSTLTSPRYLSATTRTMSSDDAYMSFLNKANADLHDSNRAQPPSTTQTRPAIHPDVKVPPSLTTLDTYYVSETDEPFEPVVLKWEGAKGGIWPGPSELSGMITASQDLREQITNLSIEEFDPRGQYGNVVRAVQSASGTEEVRVYRVDEGTRVEYYILGLEGEEDGGKIVGVKARAVET